MRRKNKKGWLRIVEAVVAVLIISSVLVFLSLKKTEKADISQELYNLESSVLNNLESNESVRAAILINNEAFVKKFTESEVQDTFNFTIKICDVADICPLPNIKDINKDVYVDERIISSNLSVYKPRKIKLFLWER